MAQSNHPFNLEYQYQLYLERLKFNEADMHPVQREQLKMSFMGACGQLMALFRNDLGALPEQEAIGVLEDMEKQVKAFFLSLTNSLN